MCWLVFCAGWFVCVFVVCGRVCACCSCLLSTPSTSHPLGLPRLRRSCCTEMRREPRFGMRGMLWCARAAAVRVTVSISSASQPLGPPSLCRSCRRMQRGITGWARGMCVCVCAHAVRVPTSISSASHRLGPPPPTRVMPYAKRRESRLRGRGM